MQGRNILVTGPAGHLALPIVRELARANRVWGLARFSKPADRERLEALGVTCIAKDIARDPLDDLPGGIDHVFHAGALVAMDSEADMRRTFEVNVQGTGRLLERCRGVKSFVFCSTASVYKPQPRPVLETDDYGTPIPAYSLSKIAAEQLVQFLARQWNIPTIILRIGTVYGPEATGPLVRIERMLRGKEVWVNPAEPRQGTLMWVDDAVRLAIQAFGAAQVPPVTVNFAGQEPVGIEDYCRHAGALLGVEPRFRYTGDTYPAVALDTTLMQRVLGPCRVGWKEGIERLLAVRHPERLRR